MDKGKALNIAYGLLVKPVVICKRMERNNRLNYDWAVSFLKLTGNQYIQMPKDKLFTMTNNDFELLFEDLLRMAGNVKEPKSPATAEDFNSLCFKMLDTYDRLYSSETDPTGQEWDDKAVALAREILEKENKKQQLPVYAQVLVKSELFIQKDNYIFPFFDPIYDKGYWFERFEKVLKKAKIKPAYADWSSVEYGCIRQKNGKPYAKNVFTPNYLKTK